MAKPLSRLDRIENALSFMAAQISRHGDPAYLPIYEALEAMLDEEVKKTDVLTRALSRAACNKTSNKTSNIASRHAFTSH